MASVFEGKNVWGQVVVFYMHTEVQNCEKGEKKETKKQRVKHGKEGGKGLSTLKHPYQN